MGQHIREVIAEASGQIKAASQRMRGKVSSFSTGFVDLDTVTSGFQQGSLIVIAGRPSMGKTCLALNVAVHAALNDSRSVAIFSLGENGTGLAKRMISSISDINVSNLSCGQLEAGEWSRMADAMERLDNASIYFDDTPRLSIQELIERARTIHTQSNPLGLIIVDALQMLKSDETVEINNRSEALTQAARLLKLLAKELHIPILLTSQVKSAVENRPDRRPSLLDLSEDIYRYSDLAISIYRDEVYDSASQDEGYAELLIHQNKNGPTGMVRLKFSGEFARFENCF